MDLTPSKKPIKLIKRIKKAEKRMNRGKKQAKKQLDEARRDLEWHYLTN
ncbi:hypothetical protein [Polynucleobacter sp. AM-25C3]|nr:hypothetical protein [Polynucleobacter sp. AM-25C3]MBU3600758.1 hypothetical protein [Polynucleobacter sp. AM-25C3]